MDFEIVYAKFYNPVYLKKAFFVASLISRFDTHFPLCYSFLVLQYTKVGSQRLTG